MNRGLIITLVSACVLTAIFVFRKIRKSQLKIGDTLYWMLFCLLLLLMAIFHKAVYAVSGFIGFESPSNFIFVVIIFLLLVKIFLLDLRVIKLEDKATKIAQKYALDHEKEDR